MASKPKTLTPTKEGVAKKAFNAAARNYKKVETYGTEALLQHATKLGIKVDQNLFPSLDAEEHRIALIESCVKGDSIFSDKLTDKPEVKDTQLQNYMFYNQLYFMAMSQLMQPNEQGSLMVGLVGSLSMLAGAAIMNEDFRKNLKEHAEDALIKYVEPFKSKAPKLWQELSARVESHPGCESPEGIAIKLLRFQHQATEAVSNGKSTREVNKLLLKKTAELRNEAEVANISWDEIIRMRDDLANTMNRVDKDRQEAYGADWKNQTKMALNEKSDGLGEKVGIDKISFSQTQDWELPVDTKSVARRLVAYQKQLQEAVEAVHNTEDANFEMPAKYAHLDGKKEHELFADALDEVAALKTYAEKVLKVKWSEVAAEYDQLNKNRYDKAGSVVRAYKGEEPHPNDIKFDVPPTESEYNAAEQAIKEHNNFMHYELPVDAASAGRCLKKYQQDAYENVRDISTRHNYKRKSMDSGAAYDLANKLCQNVQVASKILGFDWRDTVIAYRKDVFNTVEGDESKSVIWTEITDKSIQANIPRYTVTYERGKKGELEKKSVRLSKKESVAAWDGALFDSSGNKIKDNVLLQVRNPYVSDEATIAYTGLMNERNVINLEIEELQKSGGSSIDLYTAEQKLSDIEKRFDELEKALSSDGFTIDMLVKIKNDAMEAYDERIRGFAKKYGGEVKLNESLCKDEMQKDDSASYGPEA